MGLADGDDGHHECVMCNDGLMADGLMADGLMVDGVMVTVMDRTRHPPTLVSYP